MKDEKLFLTQLCDLPLEEGRSYLITHLSEITDHQRFAQLLKDEALNQCYVQPPVSLKLAELLVFFGAHVRHLSSHALGLAAKGDAFSAMGHEKVAMEYFDSAASEFSDLGDEVSWARTRIGWIISCAWIGRAEEALQVALQARDVFLRYDERYWVCALDHNTAVIYSQTGQYYKAIELYAQMLDIYPTLTDRSPHYIERAMAMAKVNQGRNFAWLGDFERARTLLLEMRTIFSTLGQFRQLISVEVSLAELDYAQGKYGSALRGFYHARDLANEHKFDHVITSSRISNCLLKLNRVDEAVQLAASSLTFFAQSGISLDKGEALLDYATALITARRLPEALTTLNKAEGTFRAGGFERHAALINLRRTELLIEMGDLHSAYAQAKQDKATFDQQGLVTISIQASLLMAQALIKQAQNSSEDAILARLDESAALCNQVIILARQYHLQEPLYKALYFIALIALKKNNLDDAEHYLCKAIDMIERILDDLVLDLRPAFLHTTWEVYEAITSLYLHKKQPRQAFTYLERARSAALRQYLNLSALTPTKLQQKNAALLRTQSQLREWQGIYHAYSAQLDSFNPTVSAQLDRSVLETELQRCEAKVTELFERLHLQQFNIDTAAPNKIISSPLLVSSVPIEDIQASLHAQQILLTYFLSQGKLIIFAITQDTITTYEQESGMAQIERLLPPLFAHLEPRGWANPVHPPLPMVRRVLHKLYQVLLAPVLAELSSHIDTLTIVPYGPLHSLPFHALFDGTHYLIERYQISYLPAASVVTQLNQPAGPMTSATTSSIPSDPLYPLIMGYSGEGNLPRALDEASTLSEILQATCLLEEQATISALMEHAPHSSLIHIATHGKARLDAPNFSFVLLADGQLNSIDAFQLRLDHCQLVTLSGCETGLALSGGGDEQVGLGRAFLAAGASSLVMSLWPVEDTATNELMTLFYQALTAGQTKAQALRSAQCTLLQRASSLHPSSTHHAHPYFWAAFRLIGHPGPLLA